MTAWLVAVIAGLAGAVWALWERSLRRKAETAATVAKNEARINFAAAKAEHAYAEEQLLRANRLERAASEMTEACRAEVPKVIAEIRDPADAAAVAGDRLLAAFQRAMERTARPAPAGAELHREGASTVPGAGGK